MSGFWIFMLIINLLIPVIMIIFGWYFKNNAPSEINRTFGYRTKRSMKTRETWIFAHHFFGRLWLIVGFILLPLTIISMLFCLGGSTDNIALFGMCVLIAETIIMLAPVAAVESSLKKHFDQNGFRR